MGPLFDHPSEQVRLRVVIRVEICLFLGLTVLFDTTLKSRVANADVQPPQPCSLFFQSRLQKMLDQLPIKRFHASGPLTVQPPIPLANANGNRGIYFQQQVVKYSVECGTAESTFDVVEKKWTGLPLLCACRQRLEVTIAVPLCMWGRIDRWRVRDAFTSALVTSAFSQAVKSSMRGQPFIREIVRLDLALGQQPY